MDENAEWMGRLRLAAVECNYRDRQTIEGTVHTGAK